MTPELTQKLIQNSRAEIARRVVHEDNKRHISLLLLACLINRKTSDESVGFGRNPNGSG